MGQKIDIDTIQKMVNENGIIFLSYIGLLSQTLIADMTEILEQEAKEQGLKMGISNNMFTIFIELSQNMLNYSKRVEKDEKVPQGLILVSRDKEYNYYIHSQNVISEDDRKKIEPILLKIESLDKDGIKKAYKELRRGKNSHSKGGGIGFFEIAKKCDELEFDFVKISDNRYNFYIKAKLVTKKDG